MMLRFVLTTVVALWGVTARAEIEIKEMTTPGGIDAWLVEAHELPFVALEIIIRGGTNADPEGARGAVNLMMALIEEGSGEMDARAFQTAREDLAAQFGFRAYADSVGISATFLTENADEATALLRQALVAPRFDDDAIERVRGQVLAGLARDAVTPNSIAGDTFWALAYPDHPYGSVGDGTVESVTALTRDDLLAAHATALTRGEISVGVVGDITEAEVGPMLDALLGDLPATAPADLGAVPYDLAGGVTVVDFATPQSVALFAQRGPDREHPDYFAAYVLNYILGGGGFESRLMTEVREKRGLTYGISSFLVNREWTDVWMGSVASDNARMAETIDVTRQVWADVAANGVTEDELAAAKTYLTGEYPLRFDGNGPIAEILAGMQYTGLPADYVVNRNSFIEAVTLEDVNRVAAEWLDPEALHFVVVGQPVGVESSQP
jgi:zinc protease